MGQKIFIVIVNYDGLVYTRDCLKSLEKIKKENLEVETVVVDNASREDELSVIKKEFPAVKTIKSKENLGFTGGNNLGFGYAVGKEADFILLLNNDTVVEEGFLAELVDFFQKNKKAGIVGSALLMKEDGQEKYDLGGYLTSFGRTYHKHTSNVKKISPRQVNYVCGASLMVKREVVEKIGFLDENYFWGYEDVDFCQRVRQAGYEVWLDSNSVVEHKVGGAIKATPNYKIYYNLRNNLLFIGKYFNFFQQLLAYIYLVLLSIKILLNQPRNCRAVYRAWGDFISRRFGKLKLSI
ncbi:MAG: glycosyltransferase family 2 protein [Patescibacteria group bacterium]|nr:glycosyltransferase family 2 protein [Patescibacteria group bacterium]